MNKYDPGAKVESQDKGVALHVARQERNIGNNSVHITG